MSEQPAAPPSAPKPKGKTYLGLTRPQLYIVGGVFVAVLGYILWKRHQASAAAAATSGGTTSAGSNECTDANGNPVDCGQLEASELADLQNQLDQLGAGGAGSGGSSGGGGWSGTGTGDGSSSDNGTGATGTTGTTTTTSGTPTTSTGTTSTGTKTAPKTAGDITGLAASNVTKTSFTAKWNAASNASQGYSWVVRDLASHTQTSAGKTNSTSVTVSGLKSGTDYNFGIQALPGGAGDNMHVRTK